MSEIKTKYFDKGLREHMAKDYNVIGKLMSKLSYLSSLHQQNNCRSSSSGFWLLSKMVKIPKSDQSQNTSRKYKSEK